MLPFALLILTVVSTTTVQACFNITTLVAGSTINGNVCSPAAFTSDANCVITGNIVAADAVTLGANNVVNGSITAGAAFTSGASSYVGGRQIHLFPQSNTNNTIICKQRMRDCWRCHHFGRQHHRDRHSHQWHRFCFVWEQCSLRKHSMPAVALII